MTSSSNFFDVVLFLLFFLVTGPSFTSISSLVLELWQFSFMRDWPEIRKSEIPQSEFCPISGDWGKLRIPNLARMSLIKCYWMLQNARVTGFTISELLRGKTTKQRRGVKLLSSTQIRVLGNTDNPHVLFNEVKSTRSCKDMSVNFVSLLEIYCKAWWNHFKIQLNCEHA